MLNAMVKYKMASLPVLLANQENASNFLPVIDLLPEKGFLEILNHYGQCCSQNFLWKGGIDH